jgi:hypothetical protein
MKEHNFFLSRYFLLCALKEQRNKKSWQRKNLLLFFLLFLSFCTFFSFRYLFCR